MAKNMPLWCPDFWRVKEIYMFTDLYLKRRNDEFGEEGADLKWPPLLRELFLTLKRAHAVLKELNPDLSLPDAIKVEKGVLMDFVEDLGFCLYHVFQVSSVDPDTAKRLGASDIIRNSCFEYYFNDSTPLILFWAFLYSHLLRFIEGRGDCVGKGADQIDPLAIEQTEEDSRMQSQAIDKKFKAINEALDLGRIPKSLDLDELYEIRPRGEHDGVLGEGAEGKVYKRVWRDEEVAVKEVSKASLQALVSSGSVAWGSRASEGVARDLSLDREVRILDWLKHPNVVELKGVTRIVEGAGKYGLVMELMAGTLEDLMQMEERFWKTEAPFIEPPPLGDVLTIDILLQVARGMRFLHSSNVMHRDLKTSNVLIGLPDPSVPVDALSVPYVRVKLADFGLAVPYIRAAASSSSEAGDQESGYKLGTTFYMAPELRRHSQASYTTKVDVFSFGSICFRLATGIPLDADHLLPTDKFYHKIEQGSLSELLSRCPKYLAPLLERCWSADPQGRPDFSYICEALLSLKRHALLGLELVSGIPSSWWCTTSEPDRCLVEYKQKLPLGFKYFEHGKIVQAFSFWEGGILKVGKDPYLEIVFGMLSAQDKLDDTNYPLWSIMMRHILIVKGFWNVVNGHEARPASLSVQQTIVKGLDIDTGEATGLSGYVDILSVSHTAEQTRWDGRDANAHALIALSVKHSIIPHIRSCKTAKETWDALASLYHTHNWVYLLRELAFKYMDEGDSMNEFFTKLTGFREELISLDKDYLYNSLIPTTFFNELSYTHQNFFNMIRSISIRNPNILTFDELISVLLRKEHSGQNMTVIHFGDHTFIAKGKCNYCK